MSKIPITSESFGWDKNYRLQWKMAYDLSKEEENQIQLEKFKEL